MLQGMLRLIHLVIKKIGFVEREVLNDVLNLSQETQRLEPRVSAHNLSGVPSNRMQCQLHHCSLEGHLCYQFPPIYQGLELGLVIFRELVLKLFQPAVDTEIILSRQHLVVGYAKLQTAEEKIFLPRRSNLFDPLSGGLDFCGGFEPAPQLLLNPLHSELEARCIKRKLVPLRGMK